MTPAEHREGDARSRPWEIERDRFGISFSGPLEVGECIEVVPADDKRVLVEMIDEFLTAACDPPSEGLATAIERLNDRFAALDSVQEGERRICEYCKPVSPHPAQDNPQ